MASNIDTDDCTSSSSNEEPKQYVSKRYKTYLDPNYKEHPASSQTFRKWKNSFLQKDSKISTEKSSSSDDSRINKLDTSFESGSVKSDAVSNVESQQHNDTNSVDHLDLGNNDNNENSIINEDCNNRDAHISNENSTNNSDNEYSYISENDISDSESNSEFTSDDEKIDFYNEVMFEKSKLTVRDVIILCSALSLRFHHSDESLLALLDMMKLCAGPNFTNLNLSKYKVSQCFSTQFEHVTYNYYCDQCSERIVYSVKASERSKKKLVICDNCNKRNSIVSTSPNYFITINLAHQIEQLFSNDTVINDILKQLNDRKSSNNSDAKIKDVYDSAIHKRIMQLNSNNDDLYEEYKLTLNFNTDGAPLTRSGKTSFWPLQVVLNDLSPKLRFRFVLLGGVIMVKKEPKSNLMNLYLSKFIEQIHFLRSEGISIEKDGKTILFKFYLLSCIVDSVCRPVTQNRIQFNGYSGCSWCYQLGAYLSSCKGIRYIIEQDNELRTHESHQQDVRIAIETGKVFRGVKGYSALADLEYFNMVWSFPYEYLHGLLLGVTHQTWKLWKNGTSEFKLSNKDIKFIEEQYTCITPTHDIHRLPRAGILQGSAKPKASELKFWLLCASLPCLNDKLNNTALEHYALLVKSAYTLLKMEISEEDLLQCERDLLTYVCHYEMLYGQEAMTFNVHCLLHAVQSVRKTGPLCMNSAFPFESNIYTLKTYVNGSKGMDQQMARKHMQSLSFKVGNLESVTSSDETARYCKDLFTRNRLKTYYEDGENVTYIGQFHESKVDDDRLCLAYSKCVFKGTVYHSVKYKRAKKTDDTIVHLMNNKFGRIRDILKDNNQCLLRLSLINIFPNNPFPGVDHIKKVCYQDNVNQSITISINDVKSKVVLVKVNNACYLCTLPNAIEIQ